MQEATRNITPSWRRCVFRLLVGFAGGLCTALGLAVLVGWHTHSTTLLQTAPGFAPMQYNTAVGFVLGGGGLMALLLGWSRLAAAGGTATLLLGLLTLLEYVLQINLGIDQLFMQPYVVMRTFHPGRMGPNTALGFLLSGIVLLMLCKPMRQTHAAFIPGLLGTAVLAFGLVAGVGYLVGIQALYSWKYYTDMAVHTAGGFVVLSTGLIAYAWHQAQTDTGSTLLRLPTFVGACLITVTLCVWQGLMAQEHTRIQRTVDLAAASIHTAIVGQTTTHLQALARMAKRWEKWGQPSREAWEADAVLYTQDFPSLHVMAWVDPSWHTRWLVPQGGTKPTLGLKIGVDEQQRRLLALARDSGTLTAIRIPESQAESPALQVIIALGRGSNFMGFIVAIFRVPVLFDQILDNVAPNFALVVLDGETTIYTRQAIDTHSAGVWGREEVLNLYGLLWRTRIWPTSTLLATELSVLPEVTLGMGLLTAVLLASLLYFAQTTRLRATQVAAANTTLTAHLQQMEAIRAVSVEITRELDLGTLLSLLIQQAVDLVPAAGAGAVYLWHDATQTLTPRVWHHRGAWMHEIRFRLGEGLVGTVGQRRVGLLVNDYQASPYAHPNVVEHVGSMAVIAEPLVYRDQLVGVLALDNQGTSRVFAAADHQLLSLFAAQAAIAIINAQLFADVQERSTALIHTNTALQREILERQQAEEALRLSSQFLHATLDALPAHIAILDDTGTIVAVNAAWRRLAEANDVDSPSHGTGVNYLEMCATVTGAEANQAQDIATGIREVVAKQRDAFMCEYAASSPTALRWFLMRVARFDTPDGVRVVVVHENITELKHAEAQVQQQQEALYQREKLAAMGSLLASVAHELNNPLSVVLMQADMLRETAADEDLTEPATAISQAAERCMYIVRNFLALVRQSPPQRGSVRLNAVVEDAMQLLHYALRVDGIDVRLHLADDLPPLWADAHQLHQVVVNLVTNAHQVLRDSTGVRQLTLTTRFDASQSRVVFEVADTGPGITSEVQGRMFEPFFTTKPPGVGTGLGLPLCQGIVEGHGGAIAVESQRGSGTVLRVELPVESVPQVVSEASEPDMIESHAVAEKAVLIVDDEAGLSRALAYLLRRDGHRVDTAGNGRVALAKLQEQTYDLILCDLRMPELDGPGLYQELESRAPHLLQRFIFLTGDSLSPEAGIFLTRVAVPRLIKPFRAAEVRRVVRRALGALGGG